MTVRAIILLTAFALSGCAHPVADGVAHEQVGFMDRVTAHCGKAYGGKLVTTEAADASMAGMPMMMHILSCSKNEIRIPFHVARKDGSWDRSRTWIITRTATGLRLKHDHRHEDGSPDTLTRYGGDTTSPGTGQMQVFPVDAESIALFLREGRAVSVTNIWTIMIDARRFAYELRRVGANARHFRVEFDLTSPIVPPPPPWGTDHGR